MSKQLRYGILAGLALSVVFVWASPAWAGETPREQELLKMIKALEKRIEQLEAQQAPAKPPPAQPAPNQLEQRVEKLESAQEKAATTAPTDFRVHWKDGLRFDTQDGRFKLKIGGRLQNDWAWFDDDSTLRRVFGDAEDGTELRRGRLYMSGTLYEKLGYKAQIGFVNGTVRVRDAYVSLKDIPYVGTLRVGHYKEAFGLENMTSSLDYPLMERSMASVFTPGRNVGLAINNTALNSRLAWSLGIFRETDDTMAMRTRDGEYAITARVSGTPWLADEGRKLLHLGLSYSHRNPDSDLNLGQLLNNGVLAYTNAVQYRQRPESHLAPRYLVSRPFLADDIDLWAGEAALVYGPFSIQAEYYRSELDGIISDDAAYDGWYAMASYCLTGEHQPYSASKGGFSGIKPKTNFAIGEGWGAWQLALRYSTIDLDDGIFRGGEADNWTLGLNWYLNPNMKVMWNYVRSDIDHYLWNGDLSVLQTRFQVKF